jgi:hypothetical protein
MKLTLIALFATLSFSAIAKEKLQTAYPQLTVWPNGVDVRVWNNSDKDIQCNGMIYIYSQSGKFRTEFFNQYIRRNSNGYQHFPNFDFQDPYRNGHHSIYCRDL